MPRMIFGRRVVKYKESRVLRLQLPLGEMLPEAELRERINHRVCGRIAQIDKKEISTLEDGTRVVDIKTLAKLLGIPKETLHGIVTKLNLDGKYVRTFFDGETREIRCSRLSWRNERRYFLEDARELLKKEYEIEYRCILISEMSADLKLCPGTIANWFRRNNGKLKIELDGEEHIVSLYQSEASKKIGGPNPKYMTREEYALFKCWVETVYEGERNYNGHVKREAPEGYVTTTQAGEMIEEDAVYVESKIACGKIKAEKVEDRIWIIRTEEVERFKQEREKRKPPEGCILVWKMIRRTKIPKSTYKRSLKTRVNEEGIMEGVYNFLGENGIRKPYKIYYDIEDDAWIAERDSNEIQKVMDRRREMISRNKAAEILGMNEGRLDRRLNKRMNILTIYLPDGTPLTAAYIISGNKRGFVETEILEIKRRIDEFRKNTVYGEEIGEILGLGRSRTSVVQLFSKHGGEYGFILNGKQYTIRLRKEKLLGKEKSNSRIYLFKEEAEVLAKWRDIKALKTHARLDGSSGLCRTKESYDRLGVKEGVLELYTDKRGIRISIPIDETDEVHYVKNEYFSIVRNVLDFSSIIERCRERAVDLLQSELENREESDALAALVQMVYKHGEEESNEGIRKRIMELLSGEKAQRLLAIGITDEKLVKTEIKLDGLAEEYENLPIVEKWNGSRQVVLSDNWRMAIPVIDNGNGGVVQGEDAGILQFYLELYNQQNGNSEEIVLNFLRELEKIPTKRWKDSDFAKLVIVRDFVREKMHRESTEGKEIIRILNKKKFTDAVTTLYDKQDFRYMDRKPSITADDIPNGDIWEETIYRC